MRLLTLLLLCSCTSAVDDAEAVKSPCDMGSSYFWAPYTGGDCGSAMDVTSRQLQAKCGATLATGCIAAPYDLPCPNGDWWVWSSKTVNGVLQVHLTGPDRCESTYKLTRRQTQLFVR